MLPSIMTFSILTSRITKPSIMGWIATHSRNFTNMHYHLISAFMLLAMQSHSGCSHSSFYSDCSYTAWHYDCSYTACHSDCGYTACNYSAFHSDCSYTACHYAGCYLTAAILHAILTVPILRVILLSVTGSMPLCSNHYGERRYGECHCADCRGAFEICSLEV